MGKLHKIVCLVVLACTLSAIGGSAQAQDRKRITGTVLDSAGAPLVGVAVTIQNTSIGTSTNVDGLFVIDVRPDETLRFSYIGYATQDVPIQGRNEVDITLQPDAQMFEEVVVVGYGKQKRAAMVSSVSTVSSRELLSPGANLTNNLAGQLAGLIAVQRSGEPGRDDAEFWIRGVSSYAGGTAPLILVDGIPRDINNIEVDEVDTFTILKDASATAVYGAEGANGVVLVTTKRGLISKPKISFKAEYSLASPQRLPEFVDSATYLEMVNEAYANDNMGVYMAPEIIEKYRTGEDADLYPNSNWMDELVSNTVQSQRYTLGFRGGAENAKYFVSMAYFDQDGVFKNNPFSRYDSDFGFQRYNLRSNIDLKVSKTTNLSIDLAGQYINRRTANRSADHIFAFMQWTPPHLFPMIYSDGSLATYATESDAQSRSPFNMLYNQGYRSEYGIRFQSNVNVNQDLNFITRGLSANAKLGFDYDNTSQKLRNYGPTRYHATGRDGDGNLILTEAVSGSDVIQDIAFDGTISFSRKIYIESSLNYGRNFGRHDVGAMILYNQKEDQRNSPVTPFRKQGIVGRATYSFGNRYFIEGNFGYTGSYNFAKNHRFGFFPAVGVSYFVSNERFYPESLKKVLSSAKIRVSAGRTGNDEVAGGVQFPFRPTFETGGNGYNFNQGMAGGSTNNIGTGIYANRPENLLLQWEIEMKRNIGLDLGFWDNSIELTVDYFNNHRSNILVTQQTTPDVLGIRADPYINMGAVKNWGVDGSLAASRRFGDWRVSARGTFTFARNEILSDGEVLYEDAYQNTVGHSVGSHFVYIAERLYTEDDFIKTQDSSTGQYTYDLKPGLPQVAVPGNGYIGPGDIKYSDLNNDGLIDDKDKKRGVAYTHNPEIGYGFGINVEWKGFYVSAFFQGTANTTIQMSQRGVNSGGINTTNYFVVSPFSYGADKSNYRTAYLDRWTAENPSQDVLMPRIHVGYGHDQNKEQSTWWMRSGNFLRFKNLEVGYTFPQKWTEKMRMDNVRIYLMGNNLFVWDKFGLWDPELGQKNYAGLSYPLARTFTIGLDFNF